MPARHDPHAPSFSGDDDESLVEFFDHFEALADEYSLTEDEKRRYVVRYADHRTKHLWVLLPGFDSRDYQRLKNEIFYQYPTAEKAARCRAA